MRLAVVARVRMCATAVAVALAAAQLVAQQATFRAGIDLVNIGATVTTRAGEFVTDLRAEDFEVLEDGRKQVVTYLATGDQSASAPPLHVGLLFDTSGSMGEDITLARSAAIRFLNTLSEAVDMTLVDFDTEVRVATYPQRDFPRMVERIRSRQPAGWTAMYDALGVYLNGAAENEGRTILVVFTDGGDTRSAMTFSEVLTLVQASDVTIHTVGFLEHQSSQSRSTQRAHLSQIASAAGGQSFFPTSMKDVEAAYEKVLAQIRAQYILGYTSTNTARDGRWRKVEIKVTRPDLRGARIQSRKGYFALYAEGQ